MTRSTTTPMGWHEVRLLDICDNLKGRGLAKGKLVASGKHPCILYGELYTTYKEIIDSIKSRTDSDEGTRSVSGDVLVPASTTTSAMDVATAAALNQDGVLLGGDINILREKTNTYDPNFLAYYLNRVKKRQLARFAQGSTIIHLNGRDFRTLQICLPTDRGEQKIIAQLITITAQAIENSEALIAKLFRIKQGLIYDLLTRGIDEHGNIRSEKTHKFKDSPLGPIPKEWDVLSVERLLVPDRNAMRSGPFGSALLKSEWVDQGIPLIGIDNVHAERFMDIYARFVTPKKAFELRRYRVRPGDVMITIMGTVGRSCVAPENIGVALSSKHVWTMTFDKSRYSPYLACLQFNHAPWVLRHFRRHEQGGIMSAIRSETLRTTRLPVPPAKEAKFIEDVLLGFSEQIEKEQRLIGKLQRLKDGLMDDLLTGKVRVTSLLKQ